MFLLFSGSNSNNFKVNHVSMEDATENKNDVVVFVTKNINGVLQEVYTLLIFF